MCTAVWARLVQVMEKLYRLGALIISPMRELEQQISEKDPMVHSNEALLAQVVEKLYRLRWGAYNGLGALIVSPTRELTLQNFDEHFLRRRSCSAISNIGLCLHRWWKSCTGCVGFYRFL